MLLVISLRRRSQIRRCSGVLPPSTYVVELHRLCIKTISRSLPSDLPSADRMPVLSKLDHVFSIVVFAYHARPPTSRFLLLHVAASRNGCVDRGPLTWLFSEASPPQCHCTGENHDTVFPQPRSRSSCSASRPHLGIGLHRVKAARTIPLPESDSISSSSVAKARACQCCRRVTLPLPDYARRHFAALYWSRPSLSGQHRFVRAHHLRVEKE